MLPIDQDQNIHVPPEVACCPICKGPIVITHFTQTDDLRYTPENLHLRCIQEKVPPGYSQLHQVHIADGYTHYISRNWFIDWYNTAALCVDWYNTATLVADWLNALLSPADLPADIANYSDPTSYNQTQTSFRAKESPPMSDLTTLIDITKTIALIMHAQGVTRHIIYISENLPDEKHCIKLTTTLEIVSNQEPQHPYGFTESKFLFQPINPKDLIPKTKP